MKTYLRPAKAKSYIASTVLVALLGQQLAVAAGAPTAHRLAVSGSTTRTQLRDWVAPLHASNSMTRDEALKLISIAENRTVESYFIHGGDAQDLQQLDSDMKVLANANAKVGIANDIGSFESWWATNKTPVLFARGKMQSRNLQGFFTESFIDFKKSDNNPSALPTWMSGVISNPTVVQISLTSFLVVYGTASFFGNIIRGAMTAGPAAGVVGALVDPVVRPFRENASTAGSRLLGGTGVKINEWFARRSRKAAAKQLSGLHEGVADAEGVVERTRARLKTQGYDLTPEDYAANLEYLQSSWGETNRIWSNINNSIFKDGRSLVTDAVVNRPLVFATTITASATAAEVFHQGISANIDRIIARTGLPWKTIDTSARELMVAIDRAEQTDVVDIAKAQADVQLAKQALLALGAGEIQIDEIMTGRSRELSFVRQIIGSLAANVFHDEQYEEFNKSLPEIIRDAQIAMRKSLSIDYFHHEYGVKVTEILNAMHLKVRMAHETLAAADARYAEPGIKFGSETSETGGKRSGAKVKSRMVEMRSSARSILKRARRGFSAPMCSDLFEPAL